MRTHRITTAGDPDDIVDLGSPGFAGRLGRGQGKPCQRTRRRPPRAVAITQSVITAAVTTARVGGADTTAVGTADTRTTMDAAAHHGSRGHHTTWRTTPGVRTGAAISGRLGLPGIRSIGSNFFGSGAYQSSGYAVRLRSRPWISTFQVREGLCPG